MENWRQSSFSIRLKAMLHLRGMTKKELARAIRISVSTVSGWSHREDATPSLRIIAAVAHKLRIEPCWLAFGCKACAPEEINRLLK